MKTTLLWCFQMDMFMATMCVHSKHFKSLDLKIIIWTFSYWFFSPYYFQSLLSIRQDDKVVCPRTKEVFNFSQAEKVYIMWWLRSVWVLTWSTPASHSSSVNWPAQLKSPVELWFPNISRVTILSSSWLTQGSLGLPPVLVFGWD